MIQKVNEKEAINMFRDTILITIAMDTFTATFMAT